MGSSPQLPEAPPSTQRSRIACIACGEVHPSMGARVNCYEAEIVALRDTRRVLLAEIERLTRGL